MRNITTTQKIAFAYFLFVACFMLAGCSVNWITEVQGMLPAVGAAASAFVALMVAFGAKLPADLLTKVTSWQSQLNTDLSTLSSLITQYDGLEPGDTKDSVLVQIENAANLIVQNFTTILPELHIDDSAVQAKITAIAQAILVQLTAIAALIPVVQGHSTVQEVANAGKLPMNAQQFASHFNQILAHGTGDSSTDNVVATQVPKLTMPQSKA